MSVSAAPVSTTQAHAVSAHAVKAETKQQESAKITPHAQSADPRSAQAVSHRQSDALLNLASADHTTSSPASTRETRDSASVQAANRAYQAIQRG
ncbi:hypothetical protein SAMN05216360_101334 [Methylobacterium phyllostachyos]|uniref:Uncharacterized protein n=1 Tax=Methylobacterium phyllostachyos TaxID=582672 RepID=A0A1G9RPG7_9HYPH|nr:hypothetical protein [Methylobacterium phyllostachyos]SDM25239.1 hypothetical protein SAMN05216360_101334 [Methylobacterium phyllostachyos]